MDVYPRFAVYEYIDTPPVMKLYGAKIKNSPSPFKREGAMWVPFRTVAEASGFEVSWDGVSRTARAAYAGSRKEIAVDGVNALISDNLTYVTYSYMLDMLKGKSFALDDLFLRNINGDEIRFGMDRSEVEAILGGRDYIASKWNENGSHNSREVYLYSTKMPKSEQSHGVRISIWYKDNIVNGFHIFNVSSFQYVTDWSLSGNITMGSAIEDAIRMYNTSLSYPDFFYANEYIDINKNKILENNERRTFDEIEEYHASGVIKEYDFYLFYFQVLDGVIVAIGAGS